MDSDTGQLPIFRAEIMQINGPHYFSPSLQVVKLNIDTKGAFNNHVDIILVFLDHPPTPVDISYLVNVDKIGKF